MAGSPTVVSPPDEARELSEGIVLLEAASRPVLTRPDGSAIELGYDADGNLKEGGVFDEKGRVPLHIIRPGIGRGRGKHLYEARMLEENAGVFEGWKMYVNHRSPEAKKAAGGLPRDVRDLGGRVQESWWDPRVPANAETGHDQGAVVGMVRPVRYVRELIDDDPGLVEASIAATATAVHPTTRSSERVWCVEGINPRGSVDWVTEAGAGGMIAPLLEGAYTDEADVQEALLECLTDEELREHVTGHPGLLTEGRQKTMPSGGDDDDGESGGGGDADDEFATRVAAMVKKGMPKAMAEKAAKRSLSESNTDPEGGDVAEITTEALQEVLAASPQLLVEALTASGEAQVFIASLVEAKIAEEREDILAEGRADTERAFELARFEREAHKLIAESKLPEGWQADLRDRFSLVESAPTPELDVIAESDAETGEVTKPAHAVLTEAVTTAIEQMTSRLREASPTRVRERSAPAIVEAAVEADKDKKDAAPAAKKGAGSLWEQTLSEAGVEDPQAAYELHS